MIEGTAPLGGDQDVCVHLLGRFDVRVAGETLIDESWPRAKARALLKLVILAPGRRMRRREAEAVLWPDLGESAAANNLRKNAHYLRMPFAAFGVAPPIVIGDDWITGERAFSLDIDAFQIAAEAARADGNAPVLYEHALALYAGDLAADELDLHQVRQLRDRLATLRVDLLFELAELHLARAKYDAARERLEELLRIAPAYEEAHRALMRLHAWRGQEHLALWQYVECERALRDELDVGPGDETVKLYHEIRERRLRPPPRPAGEFVGRQVELAVLRASLADAIAGSGSVVTVAGEPGIGKTRLVQEFALYAHLRGATVVWTYCREGGADPPFQPWIQAIRSLQTAAEPATAPGSEGGSEMPKLLGASDRHGGRSPAAVDLSDARSRMFSKVAELFRQRAMTQPLVIIVDDLHDAQTPTLRLLDALARDLHGVSARILIVGCHRDSDPHSALEVTLRDLARQPRNRHVTLRPLSLSDIETLVTRVVPFASSAEFINAVGAATGGNPLAIQEVARLVDNDVADWLRIPATVHDIMTVRLERVSERCRRSLEVASVIGMEFEAGLLSALAGWARSDVDAALREAARGQFIRPCGHTDRYGFSHARVREALYARLQEAERAGLHHRTAQLLETSQSLFDRADVLPDIARHYREAARAGIDVDKAIDYALRAGEAATRGLAWEDTIDYLKLALELMETHALDPGRMAVVLEQLHDIIAGTGGEQSGGLAYLERAANLRERLGQEGQAAHLHYQLAQARSPISAAEGSSLIDVDDSMAHYRAAEPVLARTLEGSALGYFYVSLGIAAVYGMRVGEALRATRRAMEIAEQSDDEALRTVAAGVHGIALKFTGRLREGREHLERCWQASDRRGDRTLAYLSATNAGDWHEGYLHGGGDLYRRELGRPRSGSARNERAGLLHDLGAALALNGKLTEARDLLTGGDAPELAAILDFYDGDWDRAAEVWERDYDGFAATGNRYTYASRSYLLAEVYTVQGRNERAEHVLRAGLASVTAAGPCPFMEMRLRPGLALLCAMNGELDEGRHHVARCRAIMMAGEDWGRRAGRVELASGIGAAVDGRYDEMESRLRRAREIFIERHLPWDEAETLFWWGQAAHAHHRQDIATKQLREARSIYRRVSAGAAWTERLDRREHLGGPSRIAVTHAEAQPISRVVDA